MFNPYEGNAKVVVPEPDRRCTVSHYTSEEDLYALYEDLKRLCGGVDPYPEMAREASKAYVPYSNANSFLINAGMNAIKENASMVTTDFLKDMSDTSRVYQLYESVKPAEVKRAEAQIEAIKRAVIAAGVDGSYTTHPLPCDEVAVVPTTRAQREVFEETKYTVSRVPELTPAGHIEEAKRRIAAGLPVETKRPKPQPLPIADQLQGEKWGAYFADDMVKGPYTTYCRLGELLPSEGSPPVDVVRRPTDTTIRYVADGIQHASIAPRPEEPPHGRIMPVSRESFNVEHENTIRRVADMTESRPLVKLAAPLFYNAVRANCRVDLLDVGGADFVVKLNERPLDELVAFTCFENLYGNSNIGKWVTAFRSGFNAGDHRVPNAAMVPPLIMRLICSVSMVPEMLLMAIGFREASPYGKPLFGMFPDPMFGFVGMTRIPSEVVAYLGITNHVFGGTVAVAPSCAAHLEAIMDVAVRARICVGTASVAPANVPLVVGVDRPGVVFGATPHVVNRINEMRSIIVLIGKITVPKQINRGPFHTQYGQPGRFAPSYVRLKFFQKTLVRADFVSVHEEKGEVVMKIDHRLTAPGLIEDYLGYAALVCGYLHASYPLTPKYWAFYAAIRTGFPRVIRPPTTIQHPSDFVSDTSIDGVMEPAGGFNGKVHRTSRSSINNVPNSTLLALAYV